MFAGIRKVFSTATARIAAAFTGKRPEVLIVDDVEATPIPPIPKATYEAPSRVYRSRMPHSNREARRKAGLPHGTSGAKLIRRAAERRLTLRGQDVALYAA